MKFVQFQPGIPCQLFSNKACEAVLHELTAALMVNLDFFKNISILHTRKILLQCQSNKLSSLFDANKSLKAGLGTHLVFFTKNILGWTKNKKNFHGDHWDI